MKIKNKILKNKRKIRKITMYIITILIAIALPSTAMAGVAMHVVIKKPVTIKKVITVKPALKSINLYYGPSYNNSKDIGYIYANSNYSVNNNSIISINSTYGANKTFLLNALEINDTKIKGSLYINYTANNLNLYLSKHIINNLTFNKTVIRYHDGNKITLNNSLKLYISICTDARKNQSFNLYLNNTYKNEFNYTMYKININVIKPMVFLTENISNYCIPNYYGLINTTMNNGSIISGANISTGYFTGTDVDYDTNVLQINNTYNISATLLIKGELPNGTYFYISNSCIPSYPTASNPEFYSSNITPASYIYNSCHEIVQLYNVNTVYNLNNYTNYITIATNYSSKNNDLTDLHFIYNLNNAVYTLYNYKMIYEYV